eukprot:TRINITY_DN21836_c0_g1_i1.p1 TRINITY_DN21836_c0_g1~~TRINITY_DN21836_c0_g1_i1.p1  ORF type:complete len:180 (+),score=25.14 TRINITY_DN21836_c0_g1_i1:89-628(+)
MATSNGVRPMQGEDLAACVAIEAASYPPEVVEGSDVLQRHLSHYPGGCWVAVCEAEVVGYLFSAPARREDCPQALAQEPHTSSSECDVIYLHDMALLPTHRGHGYANQLLSRIDSVASQQDPRIQDVLLTAVCGANAFWAKKGFRNVEVTSDAAKKRLSTYPAACGDVVMMQAAVDQLR